MDTSSAGSRVFYNLKFTDFWVLIPAIHFAAITGYLFSYGAIFGSSVLYLISTADIGSAAIRAMPIVYFITLTSLGIVLLSNPFRLEKFIESDNKNKSLFLITVIVLCVTMSLLAIFALVYGIYKSHHYNLPFKPIYAAGVWMALWLFPGIIIIRKIEGSTKEFFIIILILSTFSFSTYNGAQDAQIDKYAIYSDPLQRRARCNEFEVLQNISNDLLVVAPDGSQWIVSNECKKRLSIAMPAWWKLKIKRSGSAKSNNE